MLLMCYNVSDRPPMLMFLRRNYICILVNDHSLQHPISFHIDSKLLTSNETLPKNVRHLHKVKKDILITAIPSLKCILCFFSHCIYCNCFKFPQFELKNIFPPIMAGRVEEKYPVPGELQVYLPKNVCNDY